MPRGTAVQASEVSQSLELLYRLEGRTDDVRRLIVATWPDAPDPGSVLRRLYVLDHSAFPINYVRELLAHGNADDNRVALGRRHLATMTGRFEEADAPARRLPRSAVPTIPSSGAPRSR